MEQRDWAKVAISIAILICVTVLVLKGVAKWEYFIAIVALMLPSPAGLATTMLQRPKTGSTFVAADITIPPPPAVP